MKDGTYDNVTLTGANLATFGKNEKEGIGFTAVLEDGERIDGVMWLTTDKAVARTRESLTHAGWGGDFGDLSGVGSRPVQIVVATEEGRQQVKWVNANLSRGGGGKALSGENRSRLLSRLQPSLTPPPVDEDGDIPF